MNKEAIEKIRQYLWHRENCEKDEQIKELQAQLEGQEESFHETIMTLKTEIKELKKVAYKHCLYCQYCDVTYPGAPCGSCDLDLHSNFKPKKGKQ